MCVSDTVGLVVKSAVHTSRSQGGARDRRVMVRQLLVEPTARALRGVRPLLETHGVIFSYKPPGLAYGTEDGVPGAWAQLRAMQESGEVDCERLIPVHRLDRVTSGLMMAAKTAEAATVLGTLLRVLPSASVGIQRQALEHLTQLCNASAANCNALLAQPGWQPLLLELLQTVEGEYYVYILRKTRSIKVNRAMRHHQVVSILFIINWPKGSIREGKRGVIAKMKTCRGQ